MARRGRQHGELRRQIAHDAARLLAQQECIDFKDARRKASAKLGCRDQRLLPDNREIEQALREYQQLYLRDTQPSALKHLREVAVEAMKSLHRFDPHLTGPVLDGTANGHSPIRLYLFADTPEEVTFHLLESHIPSEQREIRLNYAHGVKEFRPSYRFWAGEAHIELIVLPPTDRSNPPLDSLRERPDRGEALPRVEALLQQD
jgi:hypothetical protein